MNLLALSVLAILPLVGSPKLAAVHVTVSAPKINCAQVLAPTSRHDFVENTVHSELSQGIKALALEGVSQNIIKKLLKSLERFPEKWQEIGRELIEATHLTNLIEQQATRIYSDMVPLRQLSTTHKVSTPYDLQRLQTRIDEIKKRLPEILNAGAVDAQLRKSIIPSESLVIRAAKAPDGTYYVFDGNGRTQALRSALGNQHLNLKIDVLVYQINDWAVVREIQDSKQRRGGSEGD
ncbi:MAG: hypothetical protein AB7F59_03330 [Bdellovibrionales bacterium]